MAGYPTDPTDNDLLDSPVIDGDEGVEMGDLPDAEYDIDDVPISSSTTTVPALSNLPSFVSSPSTKPISRPRYYPMNRWYFEGYIGSITPFKTKSTGQMCVKISVAQSVQGANNGTPNTLGGKPVKVDGKLTNSTSKVDGFTRYLQVHGLYSLNTTWLTAVCYLPDLSKLIIDSYEIGDRIIMEGDIRNPYHKDYSKDIIYSLLGARKTDGVGPWPGLNLWQFEGIIARDGQIHNTRGNNYFASCGLWQPSYRRGKSRKGNEYSSLFSSIIINTISFGNFADNLATFRKGWKAFVMGFMSGKKGDPGDINFVALRAYRLTEDQARWALLVKGDNSKTADSIRVAEKLGEGLVNI